MEIAEWADGRNNVSRLEAEYVTGTGSRSTILAWGRGCNAHVEAQRAIPLLVAGERVIIAAAGLGIPRHKIEDMLVLPDGSKRLGNVEVAEADRIVGGDVDLQVVARGKGNLLRSVQWFENQLFDKCGDAAVTDDT
jgi:hypothetical protein